MKGVIIVKIKYNLMINKKLGKLAKKNDPRTFKLSKYLEVGALPSLPISIQNDTDLSDWGMMGNDTIGDCTCAAAGHGIMAWTDPNKDLVTPPTSSIITAYSAVSGYDPTTGVNDNGAACLDVLNYWRQTGIYTHKIAAYAEVAVHNQTEVKASIFLYELTYIGVALPISAQAQAKRWSVTSPSLQGNSAPGSWGGHCVIVVGYNADGVDVITWGERVRMTWGFWRAYVEEAYCLLSADFFTANKAPNGFDLATLQNDISKL